jgi:sigma-70-like protein
MASLETLPPDQRAVIDLVLQRGRSYDDIARLLAIDRAAVRARALAAFEAIGPETGISPESRALITDYLLGQLPERVAEQTRERLASSPYDRAWARVLASELGQVASQPLPEIPDGSRAAAAASSSRAGDGDADADGASSSTAPARSARPARPREGGPRRPRLSDRPSSRRGGAIMLGVGALIVVAIVVVLIAVLGGGSSKSPTRPAASSPAPTSPANTTATTGTGTTSTTTPKAQVVGQSNLNPPGGKGQAKGVAFVVKEGTAYGIVVEAAHVAPNNHNAYAVWLYNSAADAYRVGFVSPAVGKSGQLQVGSPLPTNASHFKQLLLTLETQSNPKSPGTIVLQGPFSVTSTTG